MLKNICYNMSSQQKNLHPVTAFFAISIKFQISPVPHHDALISLYIDKWPLDDPLAVIQTNSALCFMALDNDSVLHDHRIKLFLKSAESRIGTRSSKNLILNSFDGIPRVGQFSLLKCGKFLLVESGILVMIGISIQAPLTKNPESSTLMYYKKRTLA